MSFGFSPGDIVLFTQFAAKAISSLREEGGSKLEFQLAERQCQAFLSTMNEIQSLDLSNVPDSFRDKLTGYSTNVQEFINDFRKTINRYEKSMSENSERGFFRSSPRKIQWAFRAADDLAKFRQSLAAELDLVKIVIQTSILSIVGSYNQPRPVLIGPPQSLALSRRTYQSTHHMQYNLDWNPNLMDEKNLFRRVDNLTDLVYERLLSRPGILPLSHGKINTLPDDYIVKIVPPQLDSFREDEAPQATADSMEAPFLSRQEPIEGFGTEESNYSTLASEINEYLLSMKLDQLSEQEMEYVSRSISGSHQLLMDQPMKQTTESHRQGHDDASGQPQPSNAKRSSHPNTRFRSSKKPSRSFGHEPIGLATGFLQMVGQTAKISFNLTSFNRVAPRELEALSKKLIQYSGILEAAAEVVHYSMHTGELQQLGWEILSDSKKTMKEVENLVLRRVTKRSEQLVGALQWWSTKKDVKTIMEEVESLKSTLSMMLQLYQVKMTEKQIQMAERSFEKIQNALADAVELVEAAKHHYP
ncbi:hypothetical protein V8E51_016724 [Hyaloscypha variabilis]